MAVRGRVLLNRQRAVQMCSIYNTAYRHLQTRHLQTKPSSADGDKAVVSSKGIEPPRCGPP
jgi:hypothetical protein